MTVELFFRKLFSNAHKDRWNQRLYTSHNVPHGIPGAWVQAAKDGKPEGDYPLVADGVEFLPTAREKFAAFVQALAADPNSVLDTPGIQTAFDAQPMPDREEQLELAGVFALTKLESAYWYGDGKPNPGDELVAFYGVKVAQPLPEKDLGSVLAAVIKEVRRLDGQGFLDVFCGGVEPENPYPQPEALGLTWEGVVEG